MHSISQNGLIYSVTDSISVAEICSNSRWVRPQAIEPPDTGERQRLAGSFHSDESILMLQACVVAASHLRFAPSRSIP
jgi:hypothetical protein